MNDVNQATSSAHPLDLDTDELDLFAEELPAEGQMDAAHGDCGSSLSTLGCECGLSTFFCYSD